ncbi:MAG: universal stress protein [Rhizobiaceae bacterium]|nr:universal stress protein [Rhizobiaceae bacterium]
MSIKTLAAVVYSENDARRTLTSALELAGRHSAHVIGIHGEYAPVPAVGPLGTPDPGFIQAEIDIARELSAKLEKIFSDLAKRESASTEWRAVSGYAPESGSVARIARACDMVIVQQRDPDDPTPRNPDIDTLLFECGRPVLIVPYATKVDVAFRRVLIAWNGTEQAARAAFDALPFIRSAEETEILCIDPRDTEDKDYAVSGSDIAEAFARHGARVTLSGQHSGGIPAGAAIENALSDSRADLLVMGAFSQPWLKQFLFGGTTRTLLESMPTATLMSR